MGVGTVHVAVNVLGTVPADALEAPLRAFCRSQGLAGFKVPRFVRCQHSALPTNSGGKILKLRVRQHLLKLQRESAPTHSRL
jgi:non-ribosomal peptide synthetase component E (peptide arylation enzyme)